MLLLGLGRACLKAVGCVHVAATDAVVVWTGHAIGELVLLGVHRALLDGDFELVDYLFFVEFNLEVALFYIQVERSKNVLEIGHQLYNVIPSK